MSTLQTTYLQKPGAADAFAIPATDGTAGQFLKTDGNGVLSFATVSSTEYQGPSFYAEVGTSQIPASSTWTKIQYGSEIFDTDGDYDNSTNYRFTPSKAGKYAIHVRTGFDYTVTAPSSWGIQLHKNGTPVAYQIHVGVGGYGGLMTIDHIEDMNGSTDYLEVFGYFNQANCYWGTSNTNAFMATWVHD